MGQKKRNNCLVVDLTIVVNICIYWNSLQGFLMFILELFYLLRFFFISLSVRCWWRISINSQAMHMVISFGILKITYFSLFQSFCIKSTMLSILWSHCTWLISIKWQSEFLIFMVNLILNFFSLTTYHIRIWFLILLVEIRSPLDEYIMKLAVRNGRKDKISI